jgi:hypothetical protein
MRTAGCHQSTPPASFRLAARIILSDLRLCAAERQRVQDADVMAVSCAIRYLLMSPMSKWLLRTQERWTDVLPDDLVSAQSENELQRAILRGWRKAPASPILRAPSN